MPIELPLEGAISSTDTSVLDIRSIVDKISALPRPFNPIAEALGHIQNGMDALQSKLRDASDGIFDELLVTGSGGVVAWAGSRDGYDGIWAKNIWIGGDDPPSAPFFSSGTDVVIGQNGSVAIWDLGGNEAGWLGVRVDSPQVITGATNATPIRVTTFGPHGYVNGDTVYISGVVGNTAANGYRIVKNSDATHFDLYDLSVAAVAGNGTYVSGGTSERYYAGLRTQTVAIGDSFTDYKLRAFADGSLRIQNAFIELRGSIGTITLDPNSGVQTFSTPSGNVYLTLSTGGTVLENVSGIDIGYIVVNNDEGGNFYIGDASTSKHVEISCGLSAFAASEGMDWDINGGKMDVQNGFWVNGTEVISPTRIVTAAGYKVGTDAGIDASQAVVSAVTVNPITINYLDHSSNPQSVTFDAVLGVTSATRTWVKGILKS